TRPEPERDFFDRLYERRVKRLITVAVGQARDRTTRFAEPALGCRSKLPEAGIGRVAVGDASSRRCDESKLLSKAVMQIARDSSPFLHETPIRITSMIELDLACGSNEEEHVPAEPQRVTCVHPLRVQGGIDEVVDARECGEHRAGAEPEQQLVARVLGTPREPEC